MRIVLNDFTAFLLKFNHATLSLLPNLQNLLDISSLKKSSQIEFSEEFDEIPIIYLFKTANLQNLMILSGFLDNSFLFFRENKRIFLEIPVFHSKAISSIIVIENQGFVICGSKDCKISLWKFNWEKMELISDPLRKNRNVLYGHSGEIVMMNYNEETDLLLSVDKEGICLLFSLKIRRLMRKIQCPGEKFVKGIIHEYGLLAVFSKKKAFLFK